MLEEIYFENWLIWLWKPYEVPWYASVYKLENEESLWYNSFWIQRLDHLVDTIDVSLSVRQKAWEWAGGVGVEII